MIIQTHYFCSNHTYVVNRTFAETFALNSHIIQGRALSKCIYVAMLFCLQIRFDQIDFPYSGCKYDECYNTLYT